MITILCTEPNSNYEFYANLDLWNKQRNAYNYKGKNPIIAHPPCQQWSRLKAFAKEDKEEKNLAYFCWEQVNKNGGIFEHPAGSSFFNEVNADRTKIRSINLHWFGFPAQKRTYLYFHKCKPIQLPLRFESVEKKVADLHSSTRSETPFKLIEWMITSIKTTWQDEEEAVTAEEAGNELTGIV